NPGRHRQRDLARPPAAGGGRLPEGAPASCAGLPRVALLPRPHRKHAPGHDGRRDRGSAGAGFLHLLAFRGTPPGRLVRRGGRAYGLAASGRRLPRDRRPAGGREEAPLVSRAASLPGRLATTLTMIKFSHTLFALPFALLAMVLAAGGWPPWPV